MKQRVHAQVPGEPALAAVDAEGKPGDLSVLEENDIAFDPTQQYLDLSKDEKRRTTALLMAIQAYDKLIIKEAEMYMAISREEGRRDPEFKIREATMEAMVNGAVLFDRFIAGQFSQAPVKAPITQTSASATQTSASAPEEEKKA